MSFLWGAATSAHQVEGYNIHNDWWQWEKKTPGVDRSGVASNHYERFAEDFALAKKMSHNAHRLSLEWSRLELAPGQMNEEAWNHYRAVLEELRRQGLKSFVTLHHFTNPQWLADLGGWTSPKAVGHFAYYVSEVGQRLGDLIDYWITINEPVIYAVNSYWNQDWPPQHRNFWEVERVLSHFVAAHESAYREIHRQYPQAQVGLAHHLTDLVPDNQKSWQDQLATKVGDWWFNERLLNRTNATSDFIGVNYYSRRKIKVEFFPPTIGTVDSQGSVSDVGWVLSPAGLLSVLRQVRQYKKPIFITENGLADAADKLRPDFIREHLRSIEEAQAEGIDVRGYLYWSLLDNFEWADGFSPRYGLIKVNYDTQERTLRPSAFVYKAIIDQSQDKG